MQAIDITLSLLASLLAGLIDSIVGGGGLILIPSLFALFPTTAPATLFGTNKIASVCGTGIAAIQYSRRVDLNLSIILPAASLAWVGSILGAWTVTYMDPSTFRKGLPFILTGVFVYTLLKKDFGESDLNSIPPSKERIGACIIGSVLGFYDGFFGPGTGSFFIFLLVRSLGYDFLKAAAASKILNSATNLSAIILFTLKGHVWWGLGLAMAITNVFGSLAGAKIAMKYGAKFVRKAFIFVVGSLILNNVLKIYIQ